MSIDRWSRNEIALGMCPDGPFVQLSEYESLARQHREEVEAAEAATLRSQGQAVASGDVGREAWTIADRIEFALRDAGFTEADAAKYTAAALRSQGQADAVVTDAMVERALGAFMSLDLVGRQTPTSRMRAALTAALAQQVPADGEVKAWLIRADNGMAIKCVMSEQERDALLFRGESSQFPEWTATPLVEAATPQAPQPVVDASQPQQGAVAWVDPRDWKLFVNIDQDRPHAARKVIAA